MADKIFNLEDVFLVFLDSVDISIHCRGVMALTTPSTPSTPKTSLLMILVFCANLALMGRRLLVLTTRCINKISVNRLNSF